jgi:hypothetical protein
VEKETTKTYNPKSLELNDLANKPKEINARNAENKLLVVACQI